MSELDPMLKKMIRGAMAEVDPAQVAITRRLTVRQRVAQACSIIRTAEHVSAFCLQRRHARLQYVEALRIVRQGKAPEWEAQHRQSVFWFIVDLAGNAVVNERG